MTDATGQLSMFNNTTFPVSHKPAELSEITWSYSRHKLFEQCLQRYYLNYYGANSKTAHDEERKQELHGLKKLHSRFTFAGWALHLIIQNYFRHAQKGNIWELDQLLSWAETMFKDSKKKSQYFIENKPYKNYKKHDPKMLLEYIYRFEDADALYDEAIGNLIYALTNFYENPNFQVFRDNGCSQFGLIEKTINLSNLQFNVKGQVDLAYKDNDKVVLVDWKIGSEDNIGEDSLQLATYALWAIDYFKCRTTDLLLYKAYLGSGEVKEFLISERKLEQAKAIMTQSAERLAIYQTYGELAISEPFTPCLYDAVCKNCQFQGICYD